MNFFCRSSIPHNHVNNLSMPECFSSDDPVLPSPDPVESGKFLVATSINIRNDLSVVFNSKPAGNPLE